MTDDETRRLWCAYCGRMTRVSVNKDGTEMCEYCGAIISDLTNPLEPDLKRANNSIETLRAEKIELMRRLDELNKEAGKDHNDNLSEIARLRSRLERVKNTKWYVLLIVACVAAVCVASMYATYSGHDQAYDDAVSALEESEQEKKDLQTSYDKLKSSYNAEVSLYNSALAKYNAEVESYNALNSKYDALNSKYEDEMSERISLESEIESYKSQLAAKQSEIRISNREISSLQSQVSALELSLKKAEYGLSDADVLSAAQSSFISSYETCTRLTVTHEGEYSYFYKSSQEKADIDEHLANTAWSSTSWPEKHYILTRNYITDVSLDGDEVSISYREYSYKSNGNTYTTTSLKYTEHTITVKLTEVSCE